MYDGQHHIQITVREVLRVQEYSAGLEPGGRFQEHCLWTQKLGKVTPDTDGRDDEEAHHGVDDD